MTKKKTFDKDQRNVINFYGGHALVLAAPGCGKTEILSQRILKAHEDYDIDYKDMLCVTFTNRASRDMKERVREVLGDNMADLFVGNLHRLCINFLYENQIIPIDWGIIDDTDQEEIIEELSGYSQLQQYFIKGVLDYATLLFEIENHFPQQVQKKIDPRTERNKHNYLSLAREYRRYKQENHVVDFDDILTLAYKTMMNDDFKEKYPLFSSYKWIQVDEVQDLNPLQLAIIDKLKDSDNATVIYLGDERQAIYAFLGANHNSIAGIQHRCGQNIYNLSNNYRSPMYLLDMLNDYAKTVLKIGVDKLPTTNNNEQNDDALQLIRCFDDNQQLHAMAMLARNIFFKETEESIGLLVRTNKEADAISEILSEHKIKHLKISKKDMFKMVNFKCLYGHFAIVTNDTRYNDWARVLFHTKVIKKLSDARIVIKEMRDRCLIPSDLMNYDTSSYTIEFTKAFGNKEIVIFDTETTGLDIFNDDIIQIAAIKVKNGEIVPESEIDIVIKTDKDIPPKLKDGKINPMVEEYRYRSNGGKRNHYERFMESQEAFEFFVNYVGYADLLGHNVNFDVQILRNNIKRRTHNLSFHVPLFWDTLKLSRILDPNVRKHTLEGLLELYHLEGTNSHNAMDDILATKSLACYCYDNLLPIVGKQRQYLASNEMKTFQRRMTGNYQPLYIHTLDKLYADQICTENSFDYEFQYIYNQMVEAKYIEPIKMFDYMKALFNKVVIDKEKDTHFFQQLVGHIYEFRTFNEADLYQNGIITERLHIMTIHKAKGLEFDNVFIHDVSEGVFPHYYSKNKLEDARVLYVAMSRAKKRVWLTYRSNVSSFIKENNIRHHFEEMSEGKLDKLMKFEDRFVKFNEE